MSVHPKDPVSLGNILKMFYHCQTFQKILYVQNLEYRSIRQNCQIALSFIIIGKGGQQGSGSLKGTKLIT